MRMRTPERHRRFAIRFAGSKGRDDMSPTTSLILSRGEGQGFLFNNYEPSGYSTPNNGGQNKGERRNIHVS